MANLDRDERKLYRAALRTSHRIHTRASLHDHNEDFLHWIHQPIIDGQLDVDTTETPESRASLVVVDPLRKLVANGFADNFVCVEQGVDVEALGKRVWHPQIFGTIAKVHRENGETTLELESKDTLLVEPVTWGKFIHGAGSGLGGTALAIWTPRQGTSTRDEIQMLRAIAPVRGGTFRLSYENRRTDDLAYDITAAALETALLDLSNIGPGDVVVTGGPLPHKPFTIRFTSALGNQSVSQLEVEDSTSTFDDDTRYAAKLLKTILRETGEHRFAFGNFANQRLPKSFRFPKEPESVWQVCRRIVHAVNQHSHIHWRLYYDGAGVVRVENMAHGFTFDERTVLDTPTDDEDLENFRNAVVVSVNRGNESRPAKPVIATLPKRNPESPFALRRNGVKRYIVERVDNPHVRTRARARRLARATLKRHSTEVVEVAFDSLPVPILVPGSRCRLTIDEETVHFFAKKFSMGWSAVDSMSVGITRRIRTKTRRPLHVA